MSEFLGFGEFALRLLLACVLGAVLGLERERKDKPAGLRTYMLVSLGAAAAGLVGVQLSEQAPGAPDQLRIDPIRVIEGVLGGIGFLGAGSIIRARGSVEGITTASGIWVIGVVGLCCGLGYYGIAMVTVALAWIVLALVIKLESRL